MMLRFLLLLALAASVSAGLFSNSIDNDDPINFGVLPPNYNAKEIGARLKYLRPEDPISPWEVSGLREGDILDPPSGPARNVIRDPKYNWPNNTVVYRFQPGMRAEEKLAVRQGMGIISNGTCIKFRAWKRGDKDYVYVLYNMTGCYSFVGRLGGAQVISLERNACFRYGLVAHELLHAIGLEHQHSAANRDEYVKINLTNVEPEDWDQFKTISSDVYTDYGIPYDYSSIMHYGKYAFSKYKLIFPSYGNETYSIIPYADVEIGQTRYVSEHDYLKVNIKYKCPGYENYNEDGDEVDPDQQQQGVLTQGFGGVGSHLMSLLKPT